MSKSNQIDYPQNILNLIQNFVSQVFIDNRKYIDTHTKILDQSYKYKQTPRATVIMCSDSRVQSSVFDASDINDLFVVRNIGNQLMTAPGSVEFGINYLQTPILMVVGHSGCGAIEAGMADFTKMPYNIKKELIALEVSDIKSLNEAIVHNVHHQIELSLKKFEKKVLHGELFIIGTIYDFRDDFGHGSGTLILANVNGEKDPEKLKQHPHLNIDIIPLLNI